MKSPVRENRPPGSVRGAPGNWRPYLDLHSILALFPKVETLGYYRVSLRENDLAPLSHYLVGQILVALPVLGRSNPE